MSENEKKEEEELERHGRFTPPKKPAVQRTMPFGSRVEETVHQAVTVARQSVPPARSAMEDPDPFRTPPVEHPRSAAMEDALRELERKLDDERDSPLPTSVRDDEVVPADSPRNVIAAPMAAAPPTPLPSNRDGETLAAPAPPSVSSPPAARASTPEPERKDEKMDEKARDDEKRTREREEKHSAAIASPPVKAPSAAVNPPKIIIAPDPVKKTGSATKPEERKSFLDSASGVLTNLFGKAEVRATGDHATPVAKTPDRQNFALFLGIMIVMLAVIGGALGLTLAFRKHPVSDPPAPAVAVKAKWEPLTAEYIRKNADQDWTAFTDAALPSLVYCADPEAAFDVTTRKWNLAKGKCAVLTQP